MEEKTLSLTWGMGEDLAKLLGVFAKMVQMTELAPLLKFIRDEACKMLDADRCNLYLVDEKAGTIKNITAQQVEMQGVHLSVGRSIAGHVAKTAEVVNLKDAYNSPYFDPWTDKEMGYRTRSVLCVPMRDRNSRVIGVLQALNKKKGAFSPHDEWLFKSYAACASNSISAITKSQMAAPGTKAREDMVWLSLTVENVPVGVIMLLKEEDSVIVNPAARWMLSLEINKIIDRKGVEECLKEIGLSSVFKWLGNEIEELPSQEITLQRPKEKVIKADFAGIDGDADHKRGVVIVLRDVTKEKGLEEQGRTDIAEEVQESTTGKKDLKHLFMKKPVTSIGKGSKLFQWLVLGLAIFALCLALAFCFTVLYG
ncbi:MAG: GAF domain-containing protein [Candidatus Brocadiales bacterium]